MVEHDASRSVLRASSTRSRRFYSVVVPGLAVVNLWLAASLFILSVRQPWPEIAEVGVGGFCCVVAGWLLGSAWSKFYWGRAIEQQVGYWLRLSSAFSDWLEDAPVPVESLNRLRNSLEEATASAESPPSSSHVAPLRGQRHPGA